MSDVDLSSFPLLTKGNKFEDFSVGQELIHHYRAIEREARSATAAHRKAMQALFRESNRS